MEDNKIAKAWHLFCQVVSAMQPTTQTIPNNPFRNRVPEAALDYAYDLWQLYKFKFKLSSVRKTKLGDFRVLPGGGLQVSVNHNLNPYQFLLTYLHEVAHVLTWQKFKQKAEPHGPEWKKNFGTLLQPVLNTHCFPVEVLRPLQVYAQAPSATLAGAPLLSLALQKFNSPVPHVKSAALFQLQPGDVFRFNNHTYKHVGKKRTRVLCEHVNTGRRYLIPQAAAVEQV